MSTTQDIDVLARTIYGEARGEYGRLDGGVAALIAVANVINNRNTIKSWFGQSIPEVCQKPWQFSCWNPSDPNRALVSAGVICDPIFNICEMVAKSVIEGRCLDLTKGADHYYATTLSRPPKWAVGKRPTVKIGRHLFFRLSK